MLAVAICYSPLKRDVLFEQSLRKLTTINQEFVNRDSDLQTDMRSVISIMIIHLIFNKNLMIILNDSCVKLMKKITYVVAKLFYRA